MRQILAGEAVDAEGKQFVFRSVAATHRPDQDVPILTGALGPKSLRMSGKIADGTVMSVLSGTRYLEAALEQIRAGMAESGRTEHAVPTFALFSVATDGKAARAPVRPMLAAYLVAVGAHNPLTAPYGYNDHLAELIAAGREPSTWHARCPRNGSTSWPSRATPTRCRSGSPRSARRARPAWCCAGHPTTALAELELLANARAGS